MNSFLKYAGLALSLCFASNVAAHTPMLERITLNHEIDKGCGRCGDHKKKCPGKCPLVATNYTPLPGVHLEFKIDDNLETDPLPSGADSMAGFSEFLGFDSAQTEAYWRAGLRYVKCRFGIDATNATFDPVFGLTFLTVAPDGSSVQTPGFTPSTNVIISPITFTGSGTYRVVESTAPVIETSPDCRPLVRLTEFVVSFIQDLTLSGTWGAEASPTGFIPATAGDGVAFGRYVIRGVDGHDHFFDMRSWIPSHSWPTVSGHGYFTERFQINPLDRDLFVGPGLGTLTIVTPTGPVQTPDGPRFPWYIRNDWWLGPVVSYPFLVDWDGQCPEGNTSLILPPHSVAKKCPDHHSSSR